MTSTDERKPFFKPRIGPVIDVEREAIFRLLETYKTRMYDYEPSSWAAGHISGAIEALERVLLMELE